MQTVLDILTGALGVFIDLAPWLLLGFAVAGLLHALMPPTLLGRWLGTPGLGSVSRAAALGVPLPLCSCSVIPVAVELRNGGASRGATASFLVSTPETGVDSIAASVAVLHPLMVVFRPIAAIVTAVTAGLVVERFTADTGATEASAASCCDEPSTDPAERGAWTKIRAATKHAFVDLFGDIAPWLVPAVLLTAVLTTLIEPGAIGELVGPPSVQMLLMLVIGIPVYVCATAATPVAAGVIAAGFSPGAALVFLLVGPATNLMTLRAAARTLGVGGAWAYGLSVAAVSIVCGFALDWILVLAGIAPSAVAQVAREHGPGPVSIGAAVVFALLGAWHLTRGVQNRLAVS